MKLLLANPPDPLENIGSGAQFISTLEPLGLLYIAAVCRDGGHEVHVIDAFAEKIDEHELLKRIQASQPDVAGFTSFTSNGAFLYNFGKRLKQEMPEMIVLFGNIHTWVYAEQYLRNKCCDGIVNGEGEYIVLDILNALQNDKDWHHVKSLSYLDNDELITTSGPTAVMDLSSLPFPARDLVPRELYSISDVSNFTLHRSEKGKTQKHLFSSRGCPNQCTFCTVHHHRKQRCNSVERVVDEIEYLIDEYNADYVFFMDSLFVAKKRRVIEICREIRRKKIKIKWGCEAHIGFVDEELVVAMSEAGCYDLNFGIESGVNRLLKGIKKHFTIEQAEKVIRMVKGTSNINCHGLFILGLPGETPQDSLQTIKFAQKLPLDMAQFSICTPYPGSPLFYELKQQGLIDDGILPDGTINLGSWKRYSQYACFTDNEPIWVTPEQTFEGLKKLQKKALRDFYFRPRPFYNQLRRLRPSDLSQIFKAFRETFL